MVILEMGVPGFGPDSLVEDRPSFSILPLRAWATLAAPGLFLVGIAFGGFFAYTVIRSNADG